MGLGLLLLRPLGLAGQDITGFSADGRLSWTNGVANGSYEVQWAPSLASEAMWTNDWSQLRGIRGTQSIFSVSVPMFYRVKAVATPAVAGGLADSTPSSGQGSPAQPRLSSSGADGNTVQAASSAVVNPDAGSPDWVSLANKPWFDVRDYGAKGDGVTDDTASVQAAINRAGLPGAVLFPQGVYLITSQLTVSNHYVKLQGVGIGTSHILFMPANDAVCVLFQGPPNQTLVGGGVENLSFISSDTQYAKTAIQVANVEEWQCDNVTVGFGGNQWHDANQGSIGLRIGGRQFIRVYNTDLSTDRPILIERNPYRAVWGGIDIDQSRFSDCLLMPWDGITRPNVEIAPGVNLYNTTFEKMSWTRGGWGLKWVEPPGTSDKVSMALVLRDIRWEQSTNAAGYCVQIEKDYGLQSLVIDNVRSSLDVNGYKLRNVLGASLSDVWFGGTTGTAVDVDTSVRLLTFQNCFWQSGSTASLGGLYTRDADKILTGPLPSTARYEHRAVVHPLKVGDSLLDPTNNFIGVGTANPTAGVTIAEDSLLIQSRDWAQQVAGSSMFVRLGGAGASRYGRIDVYTNGGFGVGPLTLQAGGGNVAIGNVTGPTNKLVVDGDMSARGSVMAVGSGANRTLIQHDGTAGSLMADGDLLLQPSSGRIRSPANFGPGTPDTFDLGDRGNQWREAHVLRLYQEDYPVWDARLAFGTGPTNMAAGDHGHDAAGIVSGTLADARMGASASPAGDTVAKRDGFGDLAANHIASQAVTSPGALSLSASGGNVIIAPGAGGAVDIGGPLLGQSDIEAGGRIHASGGYVSADGSPGATSTLAVVVGITQQKDFRGLVTNVVAITKNITVKNGLWTGP